MKKNDVICVHFARTFVSAILFFILNVSVFAAEITELKDWQYGRKNDSGLVNFTIKRHLIKLPKGDVVAFKKAAAQFPPRTVRASLPSGELKQYEKIDEFLAEDPLAKSGGGKLYDDPEKIWGKKSNNFKFNCHAFALSSAIDGLTANDWVEARNFNLAGLPDSADKLTNEKRTWSSLEKPTEDTNPMANALKNLLLQSSYQIKLAELPPKGEFSYPKTATPYEIEQLRDKANAEYEAGMQKFRAAFIAKTLELAKKIESDEKLQENDVVVFVLTGKDDETSFFAHSGKLTKVGKVWGLISKMGELPVMVTSLEMLIRAYAHMHPGYAMAPAFNEIRIYRSSAK